jgi:predicted ATPase/DNA-binding SARP family transcriptional activator
LQVSLDDRLVTGFESQKVRALLVYLAVNADRPHGRDALAGLLWPEQPDLLARNNLRQALANLRQTLRDRATARPFLLITRDTVQFNPASDHQVDVLAFTTLLDACSQHSHRRTDACSSCARRLEQAVELYRGSFLEAFFLNDSAAFEEWVLLTRERLQARAVAALTQLIGYHERRGGYEQAQAYTRRQLALEPWREESHRQLMRLLALTGQRSAALQQYASCRRVLAAEFGVEPEAATVELYEQIKHDDGLIPKQMSSAPTNLAAHTPPTLFIGRVRELGQLADWLEDRHCRLLTLVGPGGVGKTRLAMEVAGQMRASFPDGVWFVNLAPLRDPDLLVSAIAQTLGVQEVAGRSLEDSLKHALRQMQILLVLDNFEQIVEAAPLVAELLAAASGLAVLATSRAPLRLSGEREVAVAPLAVPEPAQVQDVAVVRGNEAVQLFVERAQAVKADFVLSGENAVVVAAICARLDGLPLALELAAARVKLFPPQALLARLDQRLSFLTNGARDLPARQQTLRSTLEWSYDLLDPAAQTLFAQLGVFVGGWTFEAAEAVCQNDGEGQIGILEAMVALVDRSLVRQETANGEPRFVMLETIREYALERLAVHEKLESLRERHLAYYLSLAEEAEPHLRGPEQIVWAERLEHEHDNLRTALAWAHKRRVIEGSSMGGAPAELRLAGALFWFWDLRGYSNEGRRWLEAALAPINGPARTAARAIALYGAGGLAANQSDFAIARVRLEESVASWRELGDTRGLALALSVGNSLGWIILQEGHITAARALFVEGVALWRKLGDRWGLAWALWGLGAASQNNDPAITRPLLEESVALFREVGDRNGLLFTLVGLGVVLRLAGDYARSSALFEESLVLGHELGNKPLISVVLQQLGKVAQGLGNEQRALTLYQESLALAGPFEQKENIAICLVGIGGIAGAVGQAECSARLLSAGETLYNAIGIPWPDLRTEYERYLATARAQLDDTAFAGAWSAGRAMTLEQAIDEALAVADTVPGTEPYALK